MLVICEFRPKNIMIRDFWAKKLLKSRMKLFKGSEFDREKRLPIFGLKFY